MHKLEKGSTKQSLQKRAIDVLKRKKMYEQQRDQLQAQIFNMDQTTFAIETAKDTMNTVEAMKGAHKAMKKEYKNINIDKIEDLTDDLADMMEDMNEVNEALGRNYGTPDDIDEADLDAELALLADDLDFEDELEGEGAVPDYLQPSNIPVAPDNAPAEQANAQTTDEYGLPMNA